MGGLESINSPVPQTLDPVLKLFGLLGVDLPRQLCLVVILQHAGVVFGHVRGSCRVNSIVVVVAAVVTSMDAEGSLALRHLEAVLHMDTVGKRSGRALYTRNEASAKMEGSGEGSEEGSEGEKR